MYTHIFCRFFRIFPPFEFESNVLELSVPLFGSLSIWTGLVVPGHIEEDFICDTLSKNVEELLI